MTEKFLEVNFKYRQALADLNNLTIKLSYAYSRINSLEKHQDSLVEKKVNIRTKEIEDKYKNEIKEKDKEIEALKSKIAHLSSILDNDSTNSGIPTSKTPLNKRKLIPNSREKSNKEIGGQHGHKRHKLNAFNKDEANEIIKVVPKVCPYCGSSDIVELNTSTDKCEVDYEVKVIKRIYEFKDCSCRKCSKIFREKIPDSLKEDNQYGKTLQSLAVCLTNEIYTPFNKTVKLISGITNEEINMSEGYIVKLQKRASENLDGFIQELKEYFPKQAVFGWDDGVIKIGKSNGILRVYCTDKVVYLVGHEHKNKDSIIEDGILNSCNSNVIVMHDHILHNYNDNYKFDNVECIIHLIRRLIKMKNNTNHSWCDKLKELISKTNKDRNELLKEDKESFSKEYLDNLSQEYDNILELAVNQNDEDSNNYFFEEEINFINDLKKYKKNYLLWAYNFSIPSTNNNSERNIRPVKSKMKISGLFQNINNAKYYANIRSYIETCKKHGINIISACIRLMNNNPYTLEEILNYENQHIKNDE